MADYQFKRAVRENVPLLIGLAGASGSGKTYTAMTLAKGMAGDKPFAVIDTEAGRAKHYADAFTFHHADIHPPFRPQTYLDAIVAADKAGYPVVIVDSMSHEWAGDGGILDWQDEEWAKDGHAEWARMKSWIKPKQSHKAMVSKLLQVRAHVILCFRAEPKIEMIDDPNKPGKKIVAEKKGPGGFKGWLPICEKNLPYELTASFLFMAEEPGVPLPMKLPAQLAPFFPTGKQVASDAGAKLAEWARGGSPAPAATSAPSQPAAQPAGRPQPEPPADNTRTWDTKELSDALSERALSMGDLAVVLGQPVTRANAVHLIDLWLIDNPGKTVDDLALAALDAHMGGAPADPPDAGPSAAEEPQPSLIP